MLGLQLLFVHNSSRLSGYNLDPDPVAIPAWGYPELRTLPSSLLLLGARESGYVCNP